jgi:hypothetical protein
MVDKLRPEQALRLMRAKASELEHRFAVSRYEEDSDLAYVIADVALLFTLLADVVESNIAIDPRGKPPIPIGDPLFNPDGTPWFQEWSDKRG